MSLIIETDIKEILNKLDQRFEKMDQRYERIDQSLNDIKLSQVELKGQINTLDTKVDGLSTRVSNQELLLRTIVGGLVLIILGGAAKMFWNFPVNP
jgi:ABC-type phosphate transport system auxiliary subunit